MVQQGSKPKAEVIENQLVVWDSKAGVRLYQLGFYGKPIGISKPKSNEFDAPLILGLIEGLYLREKKLIRVYLPPEKRSLSVKRLRKYATQIYEGFESQYMVYKDLRENGYVVLPGIKFGCEFAIYKRGPGIDHSPYLVSVKGIDENLTSTDIVRAGRLATSVRKKFIIATPDIKRGTIKYMIFNWFKA
jgi:tRNA-intron endonuclease